MDNTTTENPVTYRTPAEDDYLLVLGRAAYTFAYMEWLMIELAHRLGDKTIEALARMSARSIGSALTAAARKPGAPTGFADVVTEYKRLGNRRNAILHAHPATSPEEGQRLYRYQPRDPHFLTTAALQEFIAEVEALNSAGLDVRASL
jgi:hypothetical protein